MDERQHADRRGLDGVPAERAEVGEAGRPGVDRRRHPAPQVRDRVQAVRAAVVPVTVEVDEAGQHQQTRDVDATVIGRGHHVRRPGDRRDPSVLDDDVEGTVETGARVEDAAAVEDRSGHATLLSRSVRPSMNRTGRTGRDRTHHREAA